jgi:hypothetical protein
LKEPFEVVADLEERRVAPMLFVETQSEDVVTRGKGEGEALNDLSIIEIETLNVNRR